jgi:putative phosphoribosyl transferase
MPRTYTVRFEDRHEAGRRLAARLIDLRSGEPVVLAITAGGVTVAREIAERLFAPLDVLLVERLRASEDPALTLGGAAEDGSMSLADHAAARIGISAEELRAMARDALGRAARRGHVCRHGRPVTDVHGRPVIIVDDGAISGHSLLAAMDAVKAHGASEIHIAVPIASRQVVRALREQADRVVCLHVPLEAMRFADVYVEDLTPDDEAVADILTEAGAGGIVLTPRDAETSAASDLVVPTRDGALPARVRLPLAAAAAVVLAGPEIETLDRELGVPLSHDGFATLSLGLPQAGERDPDDDAALTELHRMAAQLVEAARWLRDHLTLGALPVAFVGWGVAGAAGLRAAAGHHDLHVVAVVTRSGRPDRVSEDLEEVSAPTLLVVGEGDEAGKISNRRADDRLTCEHELVILPEGERVSGVPDPADVLTLSWLTDHLRPHAVHRS